MNIPEIDGSVNGLINMWESKSASSISQPDLEMSPIGSPVGPKSKLPSAIEETIAEEEESDPVQALFLFISQLDMSETDPFILDHLVKAVGALAREREVKVHRGVQTTLMPWKSTSSVDTGSQSDQSGFGVDAQVQSSVQVLDAYAQSLKLEYADADVQSIVAVMDAEVQSGAVSVSDSHCQHIDTILKVDAECQNDIMKRSTSIDTQCEVEMANVECQIDQPLGTRVDNESQTSHPEESDVRVQSLSASLVDSGSQYEHSSLKMKSPPSLAVSIQSTMKKLSGDFSRSISLATLKRNKEKKSALSAGSPSSPQSTSNSASLSNVPPSPLPIETLVELVDVCTSPHIGQDKSFNSVSPELALDEKVSEANRSLYMETMSKAFATTAVQHASQSSLPPVTNELEVESEHLEVEEKMEEEENGTIVDGDEELLTAQRESDVTPKVEEKFKETGGLRMKKSFATISRLFVSKKERAS